MAETRVDVGKSIVVEVNPTRKFFDALSGAGK